MSCTIYDATKETRTNNSIDISQKSVPPCCPPCQSQEQVSFSEWFHCQLFPASPPQQKMTFVSFVFLQLYSRCQTSDKMRDKIIAIAASRRLPASKTRDLLHNTSLQNSEFESDCGKSEGRVERPSLRKVPRVLKQFLSGSVR